MRERGLYWSCELLCVLDSKCCFCNPSLPFTTLCKQMSLFTELTKMVNCLPLSATYLLVNVLSGLNCIFCNENARPNQQFLVPSLNSHCVSRRGSCSSIAYQQESRTSPSLQHEETRNILQNITYSKRKLQYLSSSNRLLPLERVLDRFNPCSIILSPMEYMCSSNKSH